MVRYIVLERGASWRVTRERDASVVGEYASLPEAISAALTLEPGLPAEVVVEGLRRPARPKAPSEGRSPAGRLGP